MVTKSAKSRRHRTYPQIYEGEWVQPTHHFMLRCCDCSLIHKMEFRVRKGRVQFRAYRDERATSAARRKHK